MATLQSRLESFVNAVGADIKTLSTSFTAKALFLDAVGQGAPNDGLTTAQPSLATTIGTLPTTGGKLLLRRGSYLFSTRLTITKQGLTIEGEGPEATTLLISGAAFQVGASDVLIKNLTLKTTGANNQLLFQVITSGAFKNWRFENVTFDGVGCNVSKIGAVQPDGVAITSAAGINEQVEFDHCEFKNYTEDGTIAVRGVDFVTVNRCYFHNTGTDINKGDALKFTYGATEWRALHNEFKNNLRDAIDCYDAHRGLIDGNHIIGPGAYGIEMKLRTVPGAFNPADRIRVVNNHIVNAGVATPASAIVGSTHHLYIAGNHIEGGSNYGINIGQPSDSVTSAVDENEGIIIIGNEVIGAPVHGLTMGGSNSAVVIGNSIRDCGNRGYSISGTHVGMVGGPGFNVSVNNVSADVWPDGTFDGGSSTLPDVDFLDDFNDALV